MSDAANGASAPRVNHIRWIGRLWSEKPWLIAGLFLLTLLSSAVAVTYPYLSKLLLDMIQGLLEKPGIEDPMRQVDRLLLVFVAVGVGGLVASLFPGVRGVTNSIFEHAIRSKYWRKVLGKDYAFFAAFPSGDIVTRLTDDLYDFPKLAWFLCSGIFRAVESISKVAFCLAAMALLDWRLTLFSLIPIPVMIALFYITQDRIYDTFQKNQQAISAINTRLEMSFSGVRIIKAYACEDKYKRFFSDVLRTRWTTEMAVAKLEVVLHLIYQYIDYVAQVGIVFAGGLMAVQGKISIGTFYAFYTYLSMLIYPILDIPQLFVSGKRAFVNIDRLEEMAAFPGPRTPSEPAPIGDIESIDLSGVSFSYGDRPGDALSDVTLRVARGERIGVIGPVGSGKSTLMKTLLGVLPPGKGSVSVNGVDLSTADLASYRAKIGYVPQEALLFSGTLRENVDFGSDEPGDELFVTSIAAAQLEDELASFSGGQDTIVGQRGVSISGGQKQRMAIARAIARRPQFLLFDDITASLDAANEERLMRRLDELYSGLGFVIVSHRLSTLQYVDKVLYLDGGKVLGFGTHDELLALPWYRSFIEEHMGSASQA
ncbi:MAG: ABC transporter ATP-binding protein/permease [Spirochaetes bacterium]|nr:ABC transporter ATP-binding protein/permease [Spirochaetota bacterium]MBU1080549.1 ABC transporter ATP-binding protein/permease [Spirochaetota bacterium]